jgi:hypothetical protein
MSTGNRRLQMRKYMLIAALVLGSATAQAAGSRGLILASNDDPATAEAPKAADTKAVEAPAAAPAEMPKETTKETTKPVETPAATPKYVARPAPVEAAPAPAAVTPKADAVKPAADKDVPRADKPRHRHESTEARVIYELHRHGIYW